MPTKNYYFEMKKKKKLYQKPNLKKNKNFLHNYNTHLVRFVDFFVIKEKQNKQFIFQLKKILLKKIFL